MGAGSVTSLAAGYRSSWRNRPIVKLIRKILPPALPFPSAGMNQSGVGMPERRIVSMDESTIATLAPERACRTPRLQ